MKCVLIFYFLLVATVCFSQSKKANFSTIDWYAETVNNNSPDTLAQLLTLPYNSQLEKVRSIFIWITQHIAYNTIRFQPFAKYYDDGIEAKEDSLPFLKPLDERVSRIVLLRRSTVCEGYARLFKTLCNLAGIQNEIITGYARSNLNTSKKFQCNHSWNAVKIDSSWYLCDVTWASGYLNYLGTQFIQDYNDNYFLTPPKYFIEDHYPEDIKWTLMSNPPTLSEFNNSPFKESSFNHHKINSYLPAKGIINATIGDTIQIELQSDDEKKRMCVTDNASPDSATIAIADSVALANRSATVTGNKINCSYIITSDSAQWLQVIYNGDVVLRYKLNIKKPPFEYPPVIIKDIVAKN